MPGQLWHERAERLFDRLEQFAGGLVFVVGRDVPPGWSGEDASKSGMPGKL
jgi:hypothetical protein